MHVIVVSCASSRLKHRTCTAADIGRTECSAYTIHGHTQCLHVSVVPAAAEAAAAATREAALAAVAYGPQC